VAQAPAEALDVDARGTLSSWRSDERPAATAE